MKLLSTPGRTRFTPSRPVAGAGLLLAALLGLGATPPYRGDAATTIDFTFSEAGHLGQQAFFPELLFPLLKRGTLGAKFLPAPKGRLRGTFAGTLTTDKGKFVTISNGSFDRPRQSDRQ